MLYSIAYIMRYRICRIVCECRLQPQHTSGRYWPGYTAGLLPLLAPPIAGLPPLNPVSINAPFHNTKVRLFIPLCIDLLVQYMYVSYAVWLAVVKLVVNLHNTYVKWTCAMRVTFITFFLLLSGCVAMYRIES